MTFKNFLNIVEMRTKVVSMGTFFSATLFSATQEGRISVLNAMLMGLATLCIDMGTTGFNTYFDYRNGTDSKRFNKEPDKVLVHEGVGEGSALLVSMALFLVAALIGLVLAIRTSYLLIFAGGFCMLVGFLYTGGPFPISRTPFGELFAGGFLGTVLFLITYYVETGSLTFVALIATLPFFFLIAMILSFNNGCDRIGDAHHGRKTLSILIGKKGSRMLIGIEAALAYVAAVCLVATGTFPGVLLLFLAVSVVFFFKEYRALLQKGLNESTKRYAMGIASKSYLRFCLAFCLSCLLTLLF